MDKSAEAFRTIGEVAEVLNTPAHVLRFWESRFPQIKPVKRAGGRRYYRPADVSLLGGIRKLLHDDGLTIRGVQKLLKEKGLRHVASLSGTLPGSDADTVADDDGSAPTLLTARVRATFAVAALSDNIAEAPMEIDAVDPDAVPVLADVHAMPHRPIDRSHLTPTSALVDADTDRREPAATLLRAMDTMRARGMRGELRDVYDRLNALRNRITQSDDRNRP